MWLSECHLATKIGEFRGSMRQWENGNVRAVCSKCGNEVQFIDYEENPEEQEQSNE